jgi:ABC transporter DrrB family efflux protein
VTTLDRTLARSRVSFASSLADTRVLVRRNLMRTVRLPQVLVFSTVQPVMFLLLFNYVFGGAMGASMPAAAGGKYINWLVPGLLIQISTFGAGQTAIGLTEDLAKGVVDRFRSLPMARSAVLAGRTVADVVRNALVLLLMLAVGAVMGFRFQTSWPQFVAGFGLALLFTFALSWVMATVGLLVRNPEAAQAAAFVPIFPLVFASSIFVPTQTMPEWLRTFADHQPISVITNALRGLMLGEGALPPGHTVGGEVVASVIWMTGITIVFSWLSVRMYRRAVV